MPSFDLLRESWIPVITPGGETELTGVHDLLARAHELRCVRAEAPVVTAALHRMLLAFVHRIHNGPGTLTEWAALWNATAFDKARIDEYWERHAGAFDLFDADTPFLQCPGLSTVEPRSPSQLLLYRAKGNNTTLFDHTVDGDRTELPADVAARWLVTLHAFDTGGTKTPYERKKSSKPGLCNQFATVLLEGDNLKETLLLNTVLYAPDMGRPKPTTTIDDLPIWERDRPPCPEPVEEGKTPDGWTDLLTWPSRRILLHGRESERGAPVVDGVVISPGTQLRGDLHEVEAMAVFQRAARKKLTLLPVRLEMLRGVWRHAKELLLPAEEGGIRQRPWTIDTVAEAVDVGELPEDKVITLRVFGQRLMPNPGAVEYWSEEALPVQLSLLRADNLEWRLEPLFGYAVGFADEVGDALKVLTRNYAQALRSEFDTRKHDGYLAERYWPRLDAGFARFLHDVGVLVHRRSPEEPDGLAELSAHFHAWRQHVEDTAREAVRTWMDTFPQGGPRQLLAVSDAELTFLRTLGGLKKRYRHDVGQYTGGDSDG